MLEILTHAVTWEPLVSVAAIVIGWSIGIWRWWAARSLKVEAKSLKVEIKSLKAQNVELSAKMDDMLCLMRQMVGKSEGEQRAYIEFAVGIATFSDPAEATLTVEAVDPDDR